MLAHISALLVSPARLANSKVFALLVIIAGMLIFFGCSWVRVPSSLRRKGRGGSARSRLEVKPAVLLATEVFDSPCLDPLDH